MCTVILPPTSSVHLFCDPQNWFCFSLLITSSQDDRLFGKIVNYTRLSEEYLYRSFSAFFLSPYQTDKSCVLKIVNLRHYKQVIYLGTNTISFHTQVLQYVTALLVIGSHQKKELYLFTSSKHYPPNLDCFLEREKNSSRLF